MATQAEIYVNGTPLNKPASPAHIYAGNFEADVQHFTDVLYAEVEIHRDSAFDAAAMALVEQAGVHYANRVISASIDAFLYTEANVEVSYETF